MSSEQIFELVKRTVREHKTSDPFSLARGLGIDVDYADLGGLKGFYIVYDNGRYVVINHYLDEYMSKLVLAHEIGHDLLHRDIAKNGGLRETGFFDMKSKPEKEANIFAANLLISDNDMLEMGQDGMTLESIASTLGVHYQIALIKAKDMENRGFEINVSDIPRADFLGE